MQKLTEKDILFPYYGKTINRRAYDSLIWTVYNQQHTLRNWVYSDDPRFRELFGITDQLCKLWRYNDISLNLSFLFEDDIILFIGLYKYRRGYADHGHPIIREVTPSQQELRVIQKIMDYLTE